MKHDPVRAVTWWVLGIGLSAFWVCVGMWLATSFALGASTPAGQPPRACDPAAPLVCCIVRTGAGYPTCGVRR